MRITRKVFSTYSKEDLISVIEERAFCEGYQAAQKEFGNKENKRKRREWELKMSGGRSAAVMAHTQNPDVAQFGGSKKGFGVPINKEAYKDIVDSSGSIRDIGKKIGLGSDIDRKTAELIDEAILINSSRENNNAYVDQLDTLKKQDRRFKYVSKSRAKKLREEVMEKEREKRAKELEEYKKRLAKTEAEPVSTVVKEGAEGSGKNIEKGLSRFKKPALIGAGIIGTAGLAYGGKKLYDKYKKKKAE